MLFRKGDNLTKQGAYASYILFIINGLAKQYLEGDGIKNFNLRIIRPGEFVGLSAVFIKNSFSYSSIALTDCQVFLVEKEAIARVVKQNGIFGYSIIKRYCEQNADLFNTVSNLMYKQMNGRMADTLLYIESLKVRKFRNISASFPKRYRRFCRNINGKCGEIAEKFRKGWID